MKQKWDTDHASCVFHDNLVVATLAARMASGTVFVHPSNRENIIQTAPGFPGVPLQAPGAIIYSQYGAQQLGIPTNAPQQVPQNSPLERFHKAEPKVLGTVQIVIGLIHIGFGAASASSIIGRYYFLALSSIGGYPFWGGIFFITSGSLCVSAANHRNSCLVKSSAAMNIISAIMSLSGICLHLSELIINNRRSSYVYPYTDTDLATSLLALQHPELLVEPWSSTGSNAAERSQWRNPVKSLPCSLVPGLSKRLCRTVDKCIWNNPKRHLEAFWIHQASGAEPPNWFRLPAGKDWSQEVKRQ
ncbi:membrane-spanning 4-domains subfamily A member 15-like isoform X2 [Erythrolamprus reginae]|uniref:membrane-spanning 4-domains subfamily A member 15-like isoform X2 n=1 Tax=Erythrolamprus reginae TaxID=121349 RepID=UPI00396CBB09